MRKPLPTIPQAFDCECGEYLPIPKGNNARPIEDIVKEFFPDHVTHRVEVRLAKLPVKRWTREELQRKAREKKWRER